MKTTNKLMTWFGGLAFLMLIVTSCNDELDGTTYFTSDEMTIMQTLVSNPDKFSMYVELVEKSGFDSALSSFGSYTCFAPNNEAVAKYISDKWSVTSVSELNSEEQIEFIKTIVKFHTTPARRLTSSFIEGRLPDTTFTGDYITTSYLEGGGIANIKINREAGFDQYDILSSNGVIHALNTVLDPYVDAVPKVMEDRGQHTIFVEAMKVTGYYDLFSIIYSDVEQTKRNNYTIFAETDEVYAQEGINSFADLVARVSPDNNDYTSEINDLNRYVAYHATQSYYYTADLPDNGFVSTVLDKNAIKSDRVDDQLKLNTLEDGTWTSIVTRDSNYPAKNGAYHSVDKFFPIFIPLAETVRFDFTHGQPEILSKEIGAQSDYKLPSAYKGIRWQPSTLEQRHLTQGNRVNYFNSAMDAHSFSWLEFDTPVLPRGKYEMLVVGNMSRSGRGALQAYWDGEPIGPVWDLTSAQNHGWPNEETMLANNFKLGHDFIVNNANVSQAERNNNSRFILSPELILSEQKSHVIRFESIRAGVTPLDFIEWIPVEE